MLEVLGQDQPRLLQKKLKYSFLLYQLSKITYFHLHIWQEYASK